MIYRPDRPPSPSHGITCISLQSGSNGNCIYVEAGDTRLLFDAGISGKQAEARLARFGRDIRQVDAVIVSHDHADHVGKAGIFHRKFGHPVWVTRLTLTEAERRLHLGRFSSIEHFEAGATLHFGDVTVQTVPTQHDAADGVGFVVEYAGRRLGILTDLGCPFGALDELVGSVDGLVLESNFDPDMLECGPYPWHLKQRVCGPHGHLSNVDAAELVKRCAGSRLRWVCLAHLSEENNTPELALDTHRQILGRELAIHVASRFEPCGLFTVD